MMFSANQDVFLFINSLAGKSHTLDSIVLFFANGLGVVLLISTLIYIARREEGWSTLVSGSLVFVPVLISVLYSELLKIFFSLPRPHLVLDQVNLLYDYGGFDSFPSSHATVYAALAVSAYLYSRRWGQSLILPTILIGLSRILVGIHWPLDVVAGFIIGALVSFSTHYLLKRLFTKTK